MKKLTTLLLGSLLFTGCGEPASVETVATTEPANQPTDQPDNSEPADDTSPSVELTDGIYLVDDYDPERDAAADLNAAISAAEQLNKRILLEVGGQW